MVILPGITGLLQHQNNIKNNINLYRPERCLCCGNGMLWFHGFYYRKPDRNSGENSLNPILIPRFFCPSCKKTVSVLPECMPARRWYIWEKQKKILELVLLGMTVRSIAKKVIPGRSTISRWISWMQSHYREHKDVICNYFPNFGLANNYEDFWKACFKEMKLSKAMYLCYASGVNVP